MMYLLLQIFLGTFYLMAVSEAAIRANRAHLAKRDMLPKAAPVKTQPVDSTIECLNYCTMEECKSFAYNGSLCNIFSQVFTDRELQAGNKWRLYEVQKAENLDTTQGKNIAKTSSTDAAAVTTTVPKTDPTKPPKIQKTDAGQPSKFSPVIGSDKKKVYQVGVDTCTDEHGGKKLLSILDQDKQNKVSGFLKMVGKRLKDKDVSGKTLTIWLGAYLDWNDGNYVIHWCNGVTFTSTKGEFFTNWKQGYPPKDKPGSLQMIAYGKDLGKWIVEDSGKSAYFFCE